MTACWLVKSEPGAYSFDDLVRDGSTCWDGVRNAEERNNLQEMRVNDVVLYYHSNVGKEVVGRPRHLQRGRPGQSAPGQRPIEQRQPFERAAETGQVERGPLGNPQPLACVVPEPRVAESQVPAAAPQP